MTLADEIRAFVHQNYFEPARRRGEHEITIRAGDVHSAMKLVGRMPAVCSALGTDKFQKEYRVRLVRREGPHLGANLRLTFEL